MTKTNKSLLVAILALVLVACSVTAFAVVLFSFNVKGDVDGNTDTIGDSVISAELTQTTLDFTTPGDKIDVPLTVKSTAKTNVTYNFGLSVKATNDSVTTDELTSLSSAILVYLDGEFCGTLASLTANGEAKLGANYIAGSGTERTRAHTWQFELHIAAEAALLGKNVDVQIATYVSSVDYTKYIFVSSSDDLIKAADDVNSELADKAVTQTIVLADNVNLTQNVEFTNPVNIELNGKTLSLGADITLNGAGTYTLSSCNKPANSPNIGSGNIVLANSNAALDIADFTSFDGTNIGALYSTNTVVNDYSPTLASALLQGRITANLANGVQSGGTIDVFGALGFYASKADVAVSNYCTYANGTITASNVTATSQTVVTVTVGGQSFTCGLRVVGGDNATTLADLLANELKHIPNTPTGEAITYDVFLPKYIEGKNIRIEWASSDPDSISADGKLADVLKENTTVTLYATIYINDAVYTTTSFTFRVTSQTRETKFKYLVAQLSPIKLTKVYKDDNKSEAYYYLPIVGNTNDYRTDFTMYGTDSGAIEWQAFKDIGLTKLTYAVKSGYNFISFDSAAQAVYLNSATFYTFAQMTVTGDFGGGETYTENVNVIIELGSNSELYELVFSYVEKTINDVDILQNMLDTRVYYGAKYERGDFYLPAEYQGIAITCEPATASGSGISAITEATVDGEKMWLVKVDPTNFTSGESSQGIKVTVKKDGDTSDGQNRILYVVAPAVIKPDSDGFANYSVFNSVKYQTVQKYSYTSDSKLEERIKALPTVTVSNADSALDVSERTGFVVDKTKGTVTNTTADYILAVDADNVTELKFAVGNDSGASNSHDKAYQFAQLLAWATGSNVTTLPVTVSGYSDTTTSEVKSDGKSYMNTTETAVLKTFLIKDVGFTEAEYTSLWEESITQPKGRVITDYTEITKLAASMTSSNPFNYFKYTEVMQWALNEKDFGLTSGAVSKYLPPNMGAIGTYDVDMSGTGNTSSTVLNWSSDPTSWTTSRNGNAWTRSKYNNSFYDEDQTEYISDPEAQCIMAFWFGISSTSNAQSFAKAFMNACIIPTYLDEDGAGKLVKAIYDKLQTSGSSFTVAMTDGVPQVSILDYSVEGVNNYLGLTSFVVLGNVSNNKVVLPAFITTSSVNGCFNRVTKLDADRTETKLTKFVMKACTSGHTTLDLTTLSRLTDVAHMDFSYNIGVSSIGDVLNLDIKKISYLDVYGVNVKKKYLEYVLENIKVNNKGATIYYRNSENERTAYAATSTSTSDELRFLNELTKVDSPYLLLANKLNAGNGDKTVQWYINEGNPAYLVDDAGVDTFTEVDTKEAMSKLLSNYYACTEDVTVEYNGTTYSLKKNNVYKISYVTQGTSSTGSFEFTPVGTFDETATSVPTIDAVDWSTATESKDAYQTDVLSTSGTAPTPTTTLRASNISSMQGYENLTISNAKNKYIDYYTSLDNAQTNTNNKGWLPTAGLYKITISANFVTTYRRYYNAGSKIVKNYNLNGNIQQVEYTQYYQNWGYADYTVTETRDYIFYYRLESANDTTVSAIWNGTYTYSKGTIYESQNKAFGYNRTGTSSPTYLYRDDDGNAPYTVSNAVATCGTKTIEGINAQTQMEAYLDDELSLNDSTFTKNDSNTITENRVFTELFTYTNPIATNSDVANAIVKATAAMDSSNYVLYKYTGATTTDEYYEEGKAVSKTYTANQGYRLRFSASVGTSSGGYSLSTINLVETAAAVNMQAILAEANLHINDAEFGNYYGNYYCYNGDTRTIDGITYTNGYVYRLMLNSDRTSFYFEYGDSLGVKKTFTTYTTYTLFMQALVDALNNTTGCLKEGAIAYYTGTKDIFYAKGLFELTYNTETMVYYFKSMGGLGNQISPKDTGEFLLSSIKGQNLSVDGISKFTNIRYIGSDTTDYYSGTGGSEQVEIVARIVDGDEVYERYFLVTVSA